MDQETLFTTAQELLDAEDEQALRSFLVLHVQEFPEEIRDEIVLFFFDEALTDHTEAMREQDAILAGGTKALEDLDAFKETLEEQIKIAQVRERLNNA